MTTVSELPYIPLCKKLHEKMDDAKEKGDKDSLFYIEDERSHKKLEELTGCKILLTEEERHNVRKEQEAKDKKKKEFYQKIIKGGGIPVEEFQSAYCEAFGKIKRSTCDEDIDRWKHWKYWKIINGDVREGIPFPRTMKGNPIIYPEWEYPPDME